MVMCGCTASVSKLCSTWVSSLNWADRWHVAVTVRLLHRLTPGLSRIPGAPSPLQQSRRCPGFPRPSTNGGEKQQAHSGSATASLRDAGQLSKTKGSDIGIQLLHGLDERALCHL